MWWQTFGCWLTSPDTSLAVIPMPDDPIAGIRRFRKGLRDVRDRAAREHPLWQPVAFGGLLSGNEAMVLVQHIGIDPMRVWSVLSRRWPPIVLRAVGAAPSPKLTVDVAAALARLRRGVEPIRIIVPAQKVVATVQQEKWIEPMPVLF